MKRMIFSVEQKLASVGRVYGLPDVLLPALIVVMYHPGMGYRRNPPTFLSGPAAQLLVLTVKKEGLIETTQSIGDLPPDHHGTPTNPLNRSSGTEVVREKRGGQAIPRQKKMKQPGSAQSIGQGGESIEGGLTSSVRVIKITAADAHVRMRFQVAEARFQRVGRQQVVRIEKSHVFARCCIEAKQVPVLA